MFELTAEQRQDLEGSQPVWAIDPKTKKEYVLVPADLYERMRAMLDEEGLDMRQVANLVEQAMREDDTADMSLKSYQKSQRAKTLVDEDFHPADGYPAIDKAFSETSDEPRMDDYDRYQDSK
jgi:hypothetical protein